jgi:hypothetical protein
MSVAVMPQAPGRTLLRSGPGPGQRGPGGTPPWNPPHPPTVLTCVPPARPCDLLAGAPPARRPPMGADDRSMAT